MTKQKIILDCDPGHDDAIAILLALSHPKIDLIAITTVAGNHPVEKTTYNAMHICQAVESDVPIYQGMGKPMVRKPIHPGYTPTSLTPSNKKHAVDFIIETLLASNGDITLVPIGPLTNIATAMLKEPGIIPKIKQIVMMGGGKKGNITPFAEFNIFADAEAAQVVLSSKAPISMIILDVTTKVTCPPKLQTQLVSGKTASLFLDIIKMIGDKPLHDPICIAWLIDPSCVKFKNLYVEVELYDKEKYGKTSFTVEPNKDKIPTSQVSVDIDCNKFWSIIAKYLTLSS